MYHFSWQQSAVELSRMIPAFGAILETPLPFRAAVFCHP